VVRRKIVTVTVTKSSPKHLFSSCEVGDLNLFSAVSAVVVAAADDDEFDDDDVGGVIVDYDAERHVVSAGHKLVLSNITRDSGDVFQCQADNGVPPTARKTFHVTVECMKRLLFSV